MYQQDDRDRREERAEKKLERLYSFMIRMRIPGGFLTPGQWIATHHIAGANSTGTIKITTRQTLQLHGLLKIADQTYHQAFSRLHLDSIAACGDVNRNVTCAAHPMQSAIHEQVHAYAARISEFLLPKTRAYYEIWLDEEKLTDKKEEEDPLYQDRYLPRKFKIGIAIPPNNDVDVLTNDLGLIAIIEQDELKGFNIAIGGGLGATHGNPGTYPRLATVIGFVSRRGRPAVQSYLRDRHDPARLWQPQRPQTRPAEIYPRPLGVDWYKQELAKRDGLRAGRAATLYCSLNGKTLWLATKPPGSLVLYTLH